LYLTSVSHSGQTQLFSAINGYTPNTLIKVLNQESILRKYILRFQSEILTHPFSIASMLCSDLSLIKDSVKVVLDSHI
jgi:hypothetical protein